MSVFVCWECKTCGWEHWAPQGENPPATCPDGECRKENPTWIGHKAGVRSSCSAQIRDDELGALKPGDDVLYLDRRGWQQAKFIAWEADGLLARVQAHI